MFKYFFQIGPPQHYSGGPIRKKYLNILGGTSKKNTLYFVPGCWKPAYMLRIAVEIA